MARADPELFSTEIVNRGSEDSGVYAGSVDFSVRVRRALPDFLSSVDLKYVKLGYHYLISSGFYHVAAAPVVCGILAVEIGKVVASQDSSPGSSLFDMVSIGVLLGLVLYVYLGLVPRSTYLVDFACFRPPDEFKISKEEFIELARKSGKHSDGAIAFQEGVLKRSGIGDETYLPRVVFRPEHKITLKDGREEASMVILGVVNELLKATKVRLQDIGVLVVNCGFLSTTPSLSAMLINHYKLGHDIRSFNLGGMGCAAGVIAVDLARDLLAAHPGRYALVVSTEAVSYTWYDGNDFDMLLPNCFFRMGAAAILLSSRHLDRWRSKYELKQLVRTHKGTEDRSFGCIRMKDDARGTRGLSVSKDVIGIGGNALKDNITTLGPLVLPVSEQLHFFNNFLFKRETSKPYLPNYKLAVEHVCVLATSKKVLDEIQKNLDLTDEYMEASRRTLERFGNTSSSSIWYELAYLEAASRIRKGDRVWQIGFGSGFKCNSVVWKALKCMRQQPHNPWVDPLCVEAQI
ncbi:3-ketoacyl-CoA synthase 15-like [Rhodamnia argentea]|uniref:3-ketoacyl-CoA synthase n=1 Tax=Rhodamnia argentea TaxID=178133 RepID=A0A8B8PI86_9MYRT|nr:3-ketoacyl-CoA synthase 15-like [Rhodamnia argentea]